MVRSPWKYLKSVALTLSIAIAVIGFSSITSGADGGARTCTTRLLQRFLVDNQRAAHDSITHDLYTGEITSIRRFSKDDNKHSLYLVDIRSTDPYTGEVRFREAFFKPRVLGDEDGWSRTPMEYVAYFLNRKLGMDYVPPTAYRGGLSVHIDGTTFSEGAFILRAPDYTPLANLPGERFPFSSEAVLSDNRVLNVLLQNKDAHYWNLGTGKHWVDGKTSPVFIDHGASLRPGTHVTMTEYDVYGNSRPVTKVRKTTFEKMKQLTPQDFQDLVNNGFISFDEMQRILKTRDGIVAYFEKLIKSAGKHPETVLIDE